VPDEVVALAHREGVVNAVVTEDPSLVDVKGGKETHDPDPATQATVAKEGTVGRVVAHDEESRNNPAGNSDEDELEGEIVRPDKSRDHGGVEEEVSTKVEQSPPGGIVVHRLREDVQYLFQ
jgi:hypothetical protein